MMTGEQYLINIAVGPVQEFIASARKLRDLWYGSHLLSELAKAVAASLMKQGCELIFPGQPGTTALAADSELNVANKILAISPAGTKPEDLVFNAKAAFRDRWRTICNDAVGRVPQPGLKKELLQKQVDDFGEFFASWVSYSPNTYTACRQLAERKLAGRKSLREFTAPSWQGAGLPKSSLDGVREAVLSGISQNDSRAYQLKKGEHLDALGVVKRFGPWNYKSRPRFDNMAQVAARPYLLGLKKASLASADIALLIPKPRLAQALYPEGNPLADQRAWDGWPEQLSSELLHPAVLEEELRQFNGQIPPDWKRLENSLKDLWQATATPMPYGCLLLGDGDNMGKALDAIQNAQGHQHFSQQLDIFARQVREAVARHEGQVIYSGGDDVLAYAPLHEALACAAACNQLFFEIMTQACKGLNISLPTFSMGMVIVHYRTPLHTALELVRQAERHAKDVGGKDCLAIIQDKRGGSPITICGNWSGEINLPDRLTRFSSAYSANQLSSRLAYQLRGIAGQCGETMLWQDETTPGNTACAEALRLIGRKRDKSSKALAPDIAVQLIQGLTNLRSLSDELVIAHQIAHATRLAQAEWNKEEV